MEKIIIHINNKPVTLCFNLFNEDIDVDELTKIDYANLYGEAVTISALLSKVGMMRAEAENHMNQMKLAYEILEANLRKKHRCFAAQNGGKIALENNEMIKLTEGGLDDLLKTDSEWLNNKQEYLIAKKQYEYMDVIFWAINSKDKKLNNIIKAVTPEELYQDLVEGVINGMVIKKTEIAYNKSDVKA